MTSYFLGVATGAGLFLAISYVQRNPDKFKGLLDRFRRKTP